ncbi:MAG: phosphatase PAP2 family protein [Rhodocyclaceae bacterium]|nr:phosphatase PAP2 family protein [Rhodocyclaceae bacterium]MBK6908112.1 phosphatase PAP2 family protein [Rhodocyclaceae bacterium]
MIATQLLAADIAVLSLADAVRTPWLDGMFALVTWFGSLVVLLPLALLAGWCGNADRRPVFIAVALLGAAALAHLGKLVVMRPRPDVLPLVPLPQDWSFPSAHAMQVTAFALGWLLRPGAKSGRVEIAFLGAVVLLVMTSRLYLQVHFLSDVIAGALLATLWVVCLRRLPLWRENVR